MALSLYEINEKILNFRYEIDEETGEILNVDELDNLNLAFDEKIESLCLFAKSLRAEASAIKTEEKNLKERREAKERKADNIEDYIARNLNGRKFETPRVKVSWRKSESVEILNEDAVPDSFLDIQVVRKPMKAEIKKRLKEAEAKGEEIPWARLNVNNNMSLK